VTKPEGRDGARESARIPSLDGLRAASIALVVGAHLTSGNHAYRPLQVMSVFGVRVFFVISGYLITSLLLKEEAKTGTVSLRFFYLRRTLRIFPPFYVFVAVVALGAALGWFTLSRYDLLAALTYTTNYHQERGWNLGHAWSLSVEEQFYLLWPFIVKMLGSARASRVALVTVIVCPLLRLGLLMFAPSFRPGIGFTFPTVADQIATGCLLACYGPRLAASPRLVAALRGPAFWCVPIVAALAAFGPSAKLQCLVWESVSNFGIALLIWRVVNQPEGWAGQVLNARPVVFVGVLSYSLYLWQQPFFNRESTLGFTRFPLNILAAISLALCSYYIVERPALRLRTRLERWLRARQGTAVPPGLSMPAPPA
jgi:peptidoglycan/LPS O-acetylase OafA/YrhL